MLDAEGHAEGCEWVGGVWVKRWVQQLLADGKDEAVLSACLLTVDFYCFCFFFLFLHRLSDKNPLSSSHAGVQTTRLLTTSAVL